MEGQDLVGKEVEMHADHPFYKHSGCVCVYS